MPGLDQIEYLTNSSMMQVDFLPRHLIIVGAATSGWSSGRCSADSAVKSRLSKWARA